MKFLSGIVLTAASVNAVNFVASGSVLSFVLALCCAWCVFLCANPPIMSPLPQKPIPTP